MRGQIARDTDHRDQIQSGSMDPAHGSCWLCILVGRVFFLFSILDFPLIWYYLYNFFNGGFIIGNDYVRMYVTLVDLSWVVVASVLVDSSWVVVASVLTGVDFIPLKFLRITE